MQAIRIYFRVLGDTGNGKLVLVGTVKIQIPFNHNEVLKGASAYSRTAEHCLYKWFWRHLRYWTFLSGKPYLFALQLACPIISNRIDPSSNIIWMILRAQQTSECVHDKWASVDVYWVYAWPRETSSLLQNNLTLTPVVVLAICLSDSLLTCCETELSVLIHFPFDSATWELFQSPCLFILCSVFLKGKWSRSRNIIT